MNSKNAQKLLIILVITNFLVRIPFLNLPAHWDEASYFQGAINTLHNNLNPFTEYWSYKPPLLSLLTAILFSLLGSYMWVGRFLIAVASSAVIYLTFILSKKITNDNDISVVSAVLLLINPLFFAQSNLFHLEIIFTVVFLATFLSYISEKKYSYLLFASILVLTKEPAVVIIALIAFFDLVTNWKKTRKNQKIKNFLYFISPIFIFVFWMILNKKFLGWFLWPYNTKFFSVSNRPWPRSEFSQFFLNSYIDHLLWVVFGLPLFAMLNPHTHSKSKALKNINLIFLMFISIFFPLFFYSGAYLPRYSLFTFPGIYIAFVLGVKTLYKPKVSRIIFSIIFSLHSIILVNSFFSLKAENWAGERTLNYIYYVKTNNRIADFINSFPIYKNATIISEDSHIFDEPFFGYTNSKHKTEIFVPCEFPNEMFILIGSIEEWNSTEIERCALENNLYLLNTINGVNIYSNIKND